MATQKEFWELAENWYQRTHKLRLVTENENETPERRSKALKLFLIMAGRMQKVTKMATDITMPKAPTNFERGGI